MVIQILPRIPNRAALPEGLVTPLLGTQSRVPRKLPRWTEARVNGERTLGLAPWGNLRNIPRGVAGRFAGRESAVSNRTRRTEARVNGERTLILAPWGNLREIPRGVAGRFVGQLFERGSPVGSRMWPMEARMKGKHNLNLVVSAELWDSSRSVSNRFCGLPEWESVGWNLSGIGEGKDGGKRKLELKLRHVGSYQFVR